jgi:hypothetical protein
MGSGFSLSPEQLALFPSYIADYKRVGLLTETIDPKRAVLAVKMAYRCAGRREPSFFIFLSSPLAGMIGAYLISEPEAWRMMTRKIAPAGLSGWPLEVWTAIVYQLALFLSSRDRRVWGGESFLVDGAGASLAMALKEEPRTRFWREVVVETRGEWPANWDALWASVAPHTFQEMRIHIARVDTGIWSPIQNEIWETLAAIEVDSAPTPFFFPAERVWALSHACGYGSQDADWLSWFAFWSKEAGLKCGRQLYGLRAVNEACGWWWPFENVCIVTDRPAEIHFDAADRLHSAAAPALRYRDGFGVYAWRGRRVERGVVAEPVTVGRIERERNAEIRRILVERYGAPNYVRDAGATEIAADEWGVLYRKDQEGDEPIYVVKVICATTGQDYFLGVDPAAYGGRAGMNARAAVASTWRRGDNSLAFKSPEEYSPEVET